LPAIQELGWPVEIHDRSRRYDVSPAFSIWAKLRHWRPDVVHSWGWMSTAAAAPCCLALGIPLVDGTIRTAKTSAAKRMVHRPGMMLSTRVVTNSRAALSEWRVPARMGRVIYNGFDPERLGLCDGPRTSRSPFRVVMTGRMTPVKDFTTLLRAAEHLLVRGGGWHFDIVGDGPMRDSLLEQSRGLREQGVVTLHGGRLEVLEIVRAAHVGVLMTDDRFALEGCSNAIMEYMACGLPVVCSRGGGNGEVVTEGVTGLLVTPGDAAELARRLDDLRRHESCAVRMGQAGRARLLQEFTVERMIESTLRVYEEATLCRWTRGRRRIAKLIAVRRGRRLVQMALGRQLSKLSGESSAIIAERPSFATDSHTWGRASR
jgi:glycosyltransferase involved in cell wall biosynthesis